MAEERRGAWQQLADIWSRLESTQRLSIVALSLAVLCTLGGLVYFMNQVEYRVLYRDLAAEDAQAIAAKLETDQVPFQTNAEGSSISVALSPTELDKLRLDIAGSGLISSGQIGWQLFDEAPITMTDFTENVNYRRALGHVKLLV